MQFFQTLDSLSGESSPTILKRGSKSTGLVRSLQMLLFSLGYGGMMSWAKYKADGDYGGGTTKALKAFMDANGFTGNGEELTQEMLNKLKERYQQLETMKKANTEDVGLLANIGPEWKTALLNGEEGKAPVFQSVGTKYIAEDDWTRLKFNRKNKGVWTLGADRPINFITRAAAQLVDSGLTESEIKVMVPVSANEGNLNAINTWDNCFMTFGMFQWTLGVGGAKGELPAFLLRLKENEPEAFETYFGKHGIDLVNTSKTTGYVSLDGEKINSVSEKEKFRKGPTWAYRFWKAGLDDRVKKVQVQHAVDRINSFWTNDGYKPLGKFHISDLVTSEYGVCLLLDHHVNRPGHLMNFAVGRKDIIGQALKKAGLQDTNPSSWGDAEEAKLIAAYLPLRFASSMTHSESRAKKIKGYLDRGELSAKRFSFQPAPRVQATRSLDAPPVDPYPLIDFNEYEQREE